MSIERAAQRSRGDAGMTLPRVVGTEALDHLAADDPAAVRSRRDLQRVHMAMGTRRIVQRALHAMPALAQRRALEPQRRAPLRVLELGAGDGSLMLGVARSLGRGWPAVELTLLDRQPLVSADTLAAYAALGWHAASDVRDVFDWAEAPAAGTPAAPRFDLIVANLFLHHFEGSALGRLLSAMALHGDRCFACEPRRSRSALLGSHLVGALGANAVTRQDAVLSVHAGFRGSELSSAWPPAAGAWQLNEYSAGLFSHCFVAQRREALR